MAWRAGLSTTIKELRFFLNPRAPQSDGCRWLIRLCSLFDHPLGRSSTPRVGEEWRVDKVESALIAPRLFPRVEMKDMWGAKSKSCCAPQQLRSPRKGGGVAVDAGPNTH